MLIDFFLSLRKAQLPVTIKELLLLIDALDHKLAFASVDDFYLLARVCLVKDEKYFDRFDRAFGGYFHGLQQIEGFMQALLPDEWLRQELKRMFSEEEMAKIESLGGLDKLLETLKKRLEQQQGAMPAATSG